MIQVAETTADFEACAAIFAGGDAVDRATTEEHGYREIVSSMVEGNDGMRAVNACLGYRELPVWVVV